MLTIQDINENKKRYAKLDTQSFQYFRAAVLDSEDGIMPVDDGRFLTLPENTIMKYLSLAADVFSNKIDDRMLSLQTVTSTMMEKNMVDILSESVAQDTITEEAFEEICTRIQTNYEFIGKILVVAFYEAWDVPAKSSDGKKLEDGEVVSKRILVSVAPVGLTKPGLEYKDSKIQARERQWTVARPEMGFLWPSWEGREDKKDKYTYFTMEPSKPGHKFMEMGLGTLPIMTATECREEFEHLVIQGDEDNDAATKYLQEIKDAIEQYYREAQDTPFPNPEMLMDADDLEKIMSAREEIHFIDMDLLDDYEEKFGGKWPKMKWLISEKDIKEAEKRRYKKKIAQLMKNAARKIKKLSSEDEDLVEKLLTEAEKNDRRSV